jgi:hypothetical protein
MLEKLSSREREDFKRIGNKLLNICFICKANDSTKSDYYFVLRQKEIFNQYFTPLGYRVDINEEYGVVQLVNSLGVNRLHLKLFESILILLLRIIYDEKKRELSLANDIIVTMGDVQEKFMALKIRDKLIDRNTLSNAFRTLRRFNIVELLDRDLTKEDARFMIYDSVLMAVRVDDIKAVYDKISNYRKGGGEFEEVDEDEAN